MKTLRSTWAIVALLVGAGLAVRVVNGFSDIDRLIRTTLPDDAFYYFGIARQLSLGHPPSIDGVNPTNGYHPLWMALLAAAWRALGTRDPILPIRVALTAGALLDAASAVVLYRLGRTLGLSIWAATAGLAVFLFNPHQVVNATCGLETALSLFLALLLVLADIESAASPPPSPLRYGVLSGLAILGRTDQVVLVACVVFRRTFALRKSIGLHDAARWLGVVALVVAAVFAPWAFYSWHTTGTLVQSSGVALPFVHSHMPSLWGIEHPSLALQLERNWASIVEASALIFTWQGIPGGVFALAAAACVASAVVSRGALRAELLGRLRALSPMLVATALLFVAHAVVRAVFREWYTAPFIAATVLVFGVFLEHAASLSRRPAWVASGAAAAIAAWVALGSGQWGADVYRQLRAGTPGARIREGHSDCGIVSYFTGRGITNLDGIVNQRALDALTHGTLLDYVRSQHFQRIYVSDYYHASLFFGPRYRESIVGVSDPLAVRVVGSPIEKDARIGPTEAPVRLGTPAGREYLGDGWKWNAVESPAASSLGSEAELVVYLPRVPEDALLELLLSAQVVGSDGRQSTAVLLNGRDVTTFEVTAAPAVYTLSLRDAVRGRNRIRLKFAAPAPRRATDAAWWRKLDGNPVLAIDAQTLWLRAGSPRAYDIAVTGADAVRCDGCYGAEVGERHAFRWTNGAATLHLPTLPIDGAEECRLAVSTAVSGSFGVQWDHATLEGGSGNYLIPKALRTGNAPHELEIRSRVFVPAAHGQSSDQRALGVALEGLTVTCF